MSNRKKQRIVIGTLCAIIVGMVVGYAVLNQVLTINGTSGITSDFSIQFTKIEENTMVNSKTITKGGVGTTTANFTVDLEKPGSSALYDLTVENIGSIDATLKSIEGIEESNNTSPLDIKFSLIGIKEGQSLNAGESKSFQVRVDWNSSSSTIPDTTKTLTLKLNYEQKTSSYIANPDIAGSYLIKNKVESNVTAGSSGLVALDNTGEVTTSTTPREYRYIGSNPDNYVMFNNELWRIIGIFDGQLKIIRNDSLGRMAWDDNDVNDWSQATLQTYLNGEYLNSMDPISQGMISSHIWSLGGSKTYDDVTTQMFYERERGAEVSEGNMTEWTGKIALMYLSDYGFATSGGSTTNRSSCLAEYLYNWRNSVSDCKNNSWLYDSSKTSWSLTHYVPIASYVFDVGNFWWMMYDNAARNWYNIQPSLYLSTEVGIISGSGSESDPFILEESI